MCCRGCMRCYPHLDGLLFSLNVWEQTTVCTQMLGRVCGVCACACVTSNILQPACYERRDLLYLTDYRRRGTTQPLPSNPLPLCQMLTCILALRVFCECVCASVVHPLPTWVRGQNKGERARGRCILVRVMTLFLRAYTYFYPWLQPPLLH